MRDRNTIMMTRNILIIIAIILFFVGSLMACPGCGGEEEGLKEGNYGNQLIVVLEGEWPVASYRKANFDTLGISFDYPEGWGCYTMPGESEESNASDYTGSGDYDNEFIHVDIEQYAEEALGGFYVHETTSLDPDLKLSKDTIAGIKIYESKQSRDPATGLFHGYISAVDPKKRIVVDFQSDEERSLEEYAAVINHFIETLEIDFDKMLLIPIYFLR